MKNALYITIAVATLILGVYFVRTDTFTRAPVVAEALTVKLKDGDSYTLVMDEVKKEIGGTTHAMLAYNGSIPGPVIKVSQGAEITINFKNATNMKTLLHSHGVRMDNAFDGSQTTQKDMEPGETFSYKLKFPDAGVFWYHPHIADYYAQEMGLYGAFIVEPKDKNYWSPANREVALFLDDILIENGAVGVDPEHARRTLMGTYGNVMLTNGQTNYKLSAKKGEVVRFYFTNAANARPFNFAIDGIRMKLVGGDNGAYERDEWRESVVLSPSERAVVDVLFEHSGAFALQNKTPDKTYVLGTITVMDEVATPSYAEDFATLKTHATTVASIDPFRFRFDAAPDKRIALTIDMMGGMMSSYGHGHVTANPMTGKTEGGIEWDDTSPIMNAMSDADMVKWHIVDEDTGKKDMDIDWKFTAGDKVKIRIFNDPKSAHPMQHPMHFHGQRFLVLAENGVKNSNLVWKDTVLVPAGTTIDILLDASNPGLWMAHCHILEHIEAGMMLAFKIE